jgi:serine/threonine protein kinase
LKSLLEGGAPEEKIVAARSAAEIAANEDQTYLIAHPSITTAKCKTLADLWRKVKPAEYKKGFTKYNFVVKTHNPNKEDRSLPYNLVVANRAMDIWAFGLILYLLCSGSPFLAVNRDDDLLTSDEFFALAHMTDDEIGMKISNNIQDTEAADLLRLVLRVKPSDRLQSFEEVLR